MLATCGGGKLEFKTSGFLYISSQSTGHNMHKAITFAKWINTTIASVRLYFHTAKKSVYKNFEEY